MAKRIAGFEKWRGLDATVLWISEAA